MSNSFGKVRSKEFQVEVIPALNKAIEAESYDTHTNNEYPQRFNIRSQTEVTHDGIDALELVDDSASPASTVLSVYAPPRSNLRFFWKTDGNPETKLNFEFANEQSTSLSGDGTWREFIFHTGTLSGLCRITLEATEGVQTAWIDEYGITQKPAVFKELTHDIPALDQPVTLRAEIAGENVSTQWYKNGIEISGATSDTLTISQFNETDLGAYKLVGTNSHGIAETQEVSIDAATSYANEFNTNLPLSIEGNEFVRSSPVDPSTGKPYFMFQLATDETASFNSVVEGPGTLLLEYDSSITNNQINLGGTLYPILESHERSSAAFPVPPGQNSVSIRFTGAIDWASGNLYSVRFQPGPAIAKQASFYGIQLVRPGENAPPYVEVAGYEPLKLEWFRDGQLVRTEQNVPSGRHELLDGDPTLNDQGEYHCTITDAAGNTLNSDKMTIAFLDLFEDVLDVPIYQILGDTFSMRYDYSDYVAGNSSLSLLGPFSEESEPFGFSFRAKSVWMKALGFDESHTFRVTDGVGKTRAIPPPSEWTEVAIKSDLEGNLIYIPPTENPDAKVLIDNITPDNSVYFEEHPNDYASYLGDEIFLRAKAFSPVNPITYRWVRDGVPLHGGENGELNISSLSVRDLGAYTAIAVEPNGTETPSQTATVSLLGKEFAEAIGYPGARISTWGDALWTVDSSQSYDGANSLRSGYLEGQQSSSIKIVLTGPASAGYYYRGVGSFQDNLFKTAEWTFLNGPISYIPAGETATIQIHVSESDNEPIEDQAKAYAWIDKLMIAPVFEHRFEDWRSEKLRDSTNLLSNEPLQKLGDDDKDDIPNWLEFALDLDPSQVDSVPSFSFSQSSEGIQTATLDYSLTQNKAFEIGFETSQDLINWFPVEPEYLLLESDDRYTRNRATINTDLLFAPPFFLKWSIKESSDTDSPSVYSTETILEAP